MVAVMEALKSAAVVGGGLAGLACGIRLKSLGWDVAVYEKRRYPLKKVCGEFLSPKGWERVLDLGAGKHLPLPPVSLSKARFYYGAKKYFDFTLRPAAYGISREALDSALAARFKELGGRLKEGEAFRSRSAEAGTEVIDASGRPLSGTQARWIGWKGYLAPGELDIQGITMLPLEGGYCGLSPVEDGRCSVCFVAKAPANVDALLRSHPFLEPVAGRIRFHASIAGFDFVRSSQPLKIGDAAAVWPPLVGDGMSRALGAGLDLAQNLDAGRTLRRSSPQALDVEFTLSKAMHSLMLSSSGKRLLGPVLHLAPWLAARAYQWSRG
jgi:flavin-dependent dehydrogenase